MELSYHTSYRAISPIFASFWQYFYSAKKEKAEREPIHNTHTSVEALALQFFFSYFEASYVSENLFCGSLVFIYLPRASTVKIDMPPVDFLRILFRRLGTNYRYRTEILDADTAVLCIANKPSFTDKSILFSFSRFFIL